MVEGGFMVGAGRASVWFKVDKVLVVVNGLVRKPKTSHENQNRGLFFTRFAFAS